MGLTFDESFLGSFIFASPLPDLLFDLFRTLERYAGSNYPVPQFQEATPARSFWGKYFIFASVRTADDFSFGYAHTTIPDQ